jgi:hypothetical protein
MGFQYWKTFTVRTQETVPALENASGHALIWGPKNYVLRILHYLRIKLT